MNEKELAYIEAAELLAQARVRFAEAFMAARFRMGEKGTDRQAIESATIKTSGDVTVCEAEMKVKELRLVHESTKTP